MTDELMTGLAMQAFNMAKHDLEQNTFNFLLGAYHDGEGLHRMTKVEALIIGSLGEDWLDHGPTKDAGFDMLRMAVDLLPPEAVVFASVVNSFTPTEQFRDLPSAERNAILKGTHDRHWREVKAGNLVVCDALMSIVQTPARVLICKQNLDGGERKTDFFDQVGFGGRMKMYGEEEDQP